MKKLLLIILAAVLCFPAIAQNTSFSQYYNKYAGQDGYTSVEISGEMLRLFSGNSGSGGSSGKSPMDGIQSIRILVSEHGPKSFTDDMNRVASDPGYKLLTSVNQSGEQVKFYIREKKASGSNSSYISEFLMLKIGGGEDVAIQIEGNIDLKSISGLSGLGISGMENLGNMSN